MVKKIEDLNFYELLEVSPKASCREIQRAYEQIRRVYEPNSIALYSLLTPEETAAILRRIEEAYRTLVYEENRKRYDQLLKSQNAVPGLPPASSIFTYEASTPQGSLHLNTENRYPNNVPDDPSPPLDMPNPAEEEDSRVLPSVAEFTGPVIRMLREQRGLSLRNIADRTKVSLRYIELIELESFSKLPARPYLRGHLSVYAQALGYPPEQLINDYLKRYDTALGKPK